MSFNNGTYSFDNTADSVLKKRGPVLDNTQVSLQTLFKKVRQNEETISSGAFVDPSKVLKAGDTMTGPLIVPQVETDLVGNPTNPLLLSSAPNGFISLGGGNLGEIEISCVRDLVVNAADIDFKNNRLLNVGSLNERIVYVPPGQFPSVFTGETTYILLGSRTLTSQVVVNSDDVTIRGTGKNESTIICNFAGDAIVGTDINITISDLTFNATNPNGKAFLFVNTNRDKTFTLKDCEFRDCLNGFAVEGYELVDLLNNLFIGFRGGTLLGSPAFVPGLQFIQTSKLQITSCEFVKWAEAIFPVPTPPTNPFIGPMILLNGSAIGAVNITSCVIHPRVTQDGIKIDNPALNFTELNISSNTFISVGLTTGSLINSNSNPNYDTVAIVEANSGMPNLKSRAGAQLPVQNSGVTATLGSPTTLTPVDINLTNLLTDLGSFGVSIDPAGIITYNRKRPVNFQVTFIANLEAVTGGGGQRVGLTLSKDGVNVPVYSFVTLDSTAGAVPKQATLTVIGSAVSGNTFRPQLVNSTNADIICRDLLVSGIEI